MARVHRCSGCRKRVNHAPYVSLRDRQTRREVRYHASAQKPECLAAGMQEAAGRGPRAIVLNFIHGRGCDANGFACLLGCFQGVLEAEEGAA